MDEPETLLSPNKDLYALLHVSPDASEDDIKRAYRQWAQVYHPDKYQSPHMKETATQNFQRICEAYEILCDENKRQIYDIYGMEGLTSGLELGPNLNKVQEIKEELERLRRLREREKLSQIRPTGSIMANLSLPRFLSGRGIMQGMAMASEVQSQLSKRSTISIGGNLGVTGKSGGGAATAVLRHQISSASSVEFVASAGLRSLIGVQTTRNISNHSTATLGLAVSLEDGSVNLSNLWTRQLSETSHGNIQLVLGSESSIAVGWQKKQEKMSAAGEIKFGIGALGAQAHCTRRFSSKSHGRISGKIGSNALELEIGGGRKISNFSTVRMMYSIGIQGIFWKFELHRGGQKLIVPILLTRHLNPIFASGAFFIPTSIYFLLKKFVLKPYFLRREKEKALENTERSSSKVKEARLAAEKAQELLQNVANRKRNKASEIGGLVITKAVYGSCKALRKLNEDETLSSDLSLQVFDVTTPLNFLVNDSIQLKLHGGIKKSGIMGFHDPCPGEPKQLLVEYTFQGQSRKVLVNDEEELVIPNEAHRA